MIHFTFEVTELFCKCNLNNYSIEQIMLHVQEFREKSLNSRD